MCLQSQWPQGGEGIWGKDIPHRLNCIFNTVKLHPEHLTIILLKSSSSCLVWMSSVCKFFIMVFFWGHNSRVFFSLLAALHLVNDWTVQVVALLCLIWAVKGVHTNTSCCTIARKKKEMEKGLTTFEADVGEKSLFHSSLLLHTSECLIWLTEMLNLS